MVDSEGPYMDNRSVIIYIFIHKNRHELLSIAIKKWMTIYPYNYNTI